jgi:hypothetical protein
MNADQKASNKQKVDASALKNITKCYIGIHKICTATAKSETNIPRNETTRHRYQFPHSCICEIFIYSHDWFSYVDAAR